MRTQPVSTGPFVSVIVPVYNDADRLLLCLDALEKQTYPGDRYEVVVVDNGSAPPVGSLTEVFPHCLVAFEARPGSYSARNRGIEVSRGEVLGFTDSDCVPGERWIEEGVSGLQDADLVGGRIDVLPAQRAAPTAAELYDVLFGFRQELNVEIGFSPTANLFTRRSVMDAVGTFNGGLKSGGDHEWCSRALAAGYQLAYREGATVVHPARSSLREISQRAARFAGGTFDKSRANRRRLFRERLRVLLRMKPPLRVILSREPRRLESKLKVIGVAYLANLAYTVEWVRLELGAASRR